MLIEISGPDGSGKSTLVDELRGRLRQRGVSGVYERTIRSESRNLLEIAQMATGAKFTQREMELAVLLDALRQINSELRQYRSSPHMHVFVLNYRLTLFARMRWHDLAADPSLSWLLDQIPPPDLTIRLTVPAEICVKRLRSRRKGDDLLGAPDLGKTVKDRLIAFDEAAGRIARDAVTIDGTLALDDVVDVAISHVWPVLSGQPVSCERGSFNELS